MTTDRRQKALAYCIKNAYAWHSVHYGQERRKRFLALDQDHERLTMVHDFCVDEFIAHDPRFAIVLPALFEDDDREVANAELTAALLFLERGSFVVPRSAILAGVGGDGDVHVERVTWIDPEPEDDCVRLGYRYFNPELANNGATISRTHHSNVMLVETAWLDAVVPAWKKQCLLRDTLDLGDEELAAMVFEPLRPQHINQLTCALPTGDLSEY